MLADQTQIEALKSRESYKDSYLRHRDPIARDRLLWQAHTFRHIAHLLPGETILEVGAGSGMFARALSEMSRGRNPITALYFDPAIVTERYEDSSVEWIDGLLDDGTLKGRRFDYVVAQNILDPRYAPFLLKSIFHRLGDGGQVVLYESNPWNIYHMTKNFLKRLAGRPVLEHFLAQPELYQLISELGFIRISVRFTDFVYPPLPRRLIWLFKNLSVILENTPYLRTLAGRILVTAVRPPAKATVAATPLTRHAQLNGKVSVVVPCHNEEMNVAPLVEGLLAHYDAYINRIILVDDNSTDGTAAALQALAKRDSRVTPIIRTPPNGVGRALRDGFAAADGDYILSMDCDFQELLPELEDMFDAIAEGYDAVQGSRFSPHSTLINYPLGKIIANRAFHILFNLVFRRRHRDLTNNLKLIRTELVRRLDIREPGFACNAEIGLYLALSGCRLKEVPVSWVNRSYGMGLSSFNLFRVGGGYARVFFRFGRETRLGTRNTKGDDQKVEMPG